LLAKIQKTSHFIFPKDCLCVLNLDYVFPKGCLMKMKQPFIRTKQPFGKMKACFIFIKRHAVIINEKIKVMEFANERK
jgi:hypothetical protein